MRLTKNTYVLGGVLFLLMFAGSLFHRQINEYLGVSLLLHSSSPREEFFGGLMSRARDPAALLERCWATAKVPHRQLVASYLRDQAVLNPPWFTNVQRLLTAGAVDPDTSVRELSLATLQARADPALFECARMQLADADPLVRQLGLDYLRRFDAQVGIPVAVGLLEDPDLQVVAKAEVALMHWTGLDFGVRVHLAIPSSENGRQLDPTSLETINRGIAQRKQWWQTHATEFSPLQPITLKAVSPRLNIPPVDDFVLPALDGKSVRLSDFRGKVVLLNFWATWCTACLAEIPYLIQLHEKLGDRVIILGISLDGLPDEDGHQPGDENTGQQGDATSRKAVINKVVRAVKSRGINYPVLIDPHAKVGRRFNGGELPTTVLIDSQGRLRRRFIGERNLRVFEAMLAEIQR